MIYQFTTNKEMQSLRRCKPYLGTYVEVNIFAHDSQNTLLDMTKLVFDEIDRIEKLMNFYDKNSELTYINSEAHLHPCQASEEMIEILSMAVLLGEKTQGLFDTSFPLKLENKSWKSIELKNDEVFFKKKLQLNLGGIAKGYAVDKAYEKIATHVEDVIINAGGDLRMKKWQHEFVGVKTHACDRRSITKLAMQCPAMATSSAYYIENNMLAIIDPKNQKPIQDKRSISVFAPNCMLADALTKVAFLHSNPVSILSLFDAKSISI